MIFQERLDRLLPYLRGFAFDERTLYARFTVLFPAHWDVGYLKSKSILLGILGQNGTSNMFLIGVSTDTDLSEHPILNDKPFDYFLDEIERVININNEKERKEAILKEKMAELQQMFNGATLEEVEKLQIVKTNYDGYVTPPFRSGSTVEDIFTPEFEVPIHDPAFNDLGGESYATIEDDFDPFSREENDRGEDNIPFVPEDEININLPGIVKDMVKHNNSEESGIPVN